MKLVSVRDLRNEAAKIWEMLPREGELVVTSNGRPIAILATVSEGGVEETLHAFRRIRAMEAVGQLQLQSLKDGRDRTSSDAIDEEIRSVRVARKS